MKHGNENAMEILETDILIRAGTANRNLSFPLTNPQTLINYQREVERAEYGHCQKVRVRDC